MAKPKPDELTVGHSLISVNVMLSEYMSKHKKNPQGYRRWVFRDIATGKKFEVINNFKPAKEAARRWGRSNGYTNIMLEG